MENETETNLEQEVKTPAPEVSTEPNPEDVIEEDGVEGEAEDEFEEVDYLDQKYKVPKTLAEVIAKAHNQDRDYTQKTQQIAEIRKAVELQREEVEIEREFVREVEQERSQLAAMDAQLQAYEKADWRAWRQANPAEAQDAFMEYQMMEKNRNRLAQTLEQRGQEYQSKLAQNRAEQIEKATQELQKPDPVYGWPGKFDTEIRTSLMKFAKDELQYTPEQLAAIRTAPQVKQIYLQKIGFDALKAKQKAATPVKAVANPVTQVNGGKGKVTVDPEKLSTAEWIARERARVARKNAQARQ